MSHRVRFAVPASERANAKEYTIDDPNEAVQVAYGIGDTVTIEGVTVTLTGRPSHVWVGRACTTTWPATLGSKAD